MQLSKPALRKPALVLVCLFLTIGCDDPATPAERAAPVGDAQRATTGPAVPDAGDATTRPGPWEETDVAALLQAGGEHWSDLTGGEFAGRALKPGDDYWIWPAGDVVYTPAEDGGKTLLVNLNWRLREGGERLTTDTVYGVLERAWPNGFTSLRSASRELDEQATSGVLPLRLSPWAGAGSGEVAVYLTKPGSPSPMSNVLRLTVSTQP